MNACSQPPARGGRWLLAFSTACALLGTAASAPAAPPRATVVASFDAAQLEAPENIAIDSRDNIYVNLALTGEIRRIAPNGAQTTFAHLPLGAPPLSFCGSFFAGLTGLTIDEDDNLYASLASCDPASRGVWKITPHGELIQLTSLPMESLPNGVVMRDGWLYIADSMLDVIWRASADVAGPAEVWLSDPLLERVDPVRPGPNGVQLFHDELYISNSSAEQILAVSFAHDGSAGSIRVHAEGAPCDDFAFDVHGSLYCGTDPVNTLVRFSRDGEMDVLLTGADGLDGTTSVIFGRHGRNHKSLYVTNGSFPFFPTSAGRPSLMRVDVGVPGYPRP